MDNHLIYIISTTFKSFVKCFFFLLLQLEDLEISVSDHVSKAQRSNFGAAWEELGPGSELEDTFALTSLTTLSDAVNQVTSFLGMYPCDRSDRVPDGKNSHTLFLAGEFNILYIFCKIFFCIFCVKYFFVYFV